MACEAGKEVGAQQAAWIGREWKKVRVPAAVYQVAALIRVGSFDLSLLLYQTEGGANRPL